MTTLALSSALVSSHDTSRPKGVKRERDAAEAGEGAKRLRDGSTEPLAFSARALDIAAGPWIIILSYLHQYPRWLGDSPLGLESEDLERLHRAAVDLQDPMLARTIVSYQSQKVRAYANACFGSLDSLTADVTKLLDRTEEFRGLLPSFRETINTYNNCKKSLSDIPGLLSPFLASPQGSKESEPTFISFDIAGLTACSNLLARGHSRGLFHWAFAGIDVSAEAQRLFSALSTQTLVTLCRWFLLRTALSAEGFHLDRVAQRSQWNSLIDRLTAEPAIDLEPLVDLFVRPGVTNDDRDYIHRNGKGPVRYNWLTPLSIGGSQLAAPGRAAALKERAIRANYSAITIRAATTMARAEQRIENECQERAEYSRSQEKYQRLADFCFARPSLHQVLLTWTGGALGTLAAVAANEQNLQMLQRIWSYPDLRMLITKTMGRDPLPHRMFVKYDPLGNNLWEKPFSPNSPLEILRWLDEECDVDVTVPQKREFPFLDGVNIEDAPDLDKTRFFGAAGDTIAGLAVMDPREEESQAVLRWIFNHPKPSIRAMISRRVVELGMASGQMNNVSCLLEMSLGSTCPEQSVARLFTGKNKKGDTLADIAWSSYHHMAPLNGVDRTGRSVGIPWIVHHALPQIRQILAGSNLLQAPSFQKALVQMCHPHFGSF